ncbi:MAG: aldehyde ferredoxin oxidoreductase N-terminal domain-containing protein [Candidatus Woesearchaeota archaeon]
MKTLYIDAEKKPGTEEDAQDFGPVDFGLRNKERLNIGIGKLAPYAVQGAHRLILSGNSMQWDDFFISTLSGAAEALYASGFDCLSIGGRASSPQVLKIWDGKLEFHSLEDVEKIFEGYSGKKGLVALEQHVYDKFRPEGNFRILAVGPASFSTSFGVIGSTVIRNGKFVEGVISFAGRGGFGSLMAQKHNIAAILIGGTRGDVWKNSADKVNEVIAKVAGKPAVQAISSATGKYRYDDALKSGGTFGVNLTSLKTWTLSFNWQSIYFTEDERKQIYDTMVAGHYLQQFNDEIIKPKKFMNCGEKCVAVCKKVYNAHKKDYEPYEAAGCNCGVFDQRAAEILLSEIDSLGFDAIEAGTIISLVMELLSSGTKKPEEYGLSSAPKWDFRNFDLVNDSMHNAKLGIEIANMMLRDDRFSKGIRAAAKSLDATNRALYTPHGKGGISPNQYWLPAFFLPLPIQGKFLSDYHTEFKEPFELGKSCADRTIKELYCDNTGFCRFHRGWSEKAMEALVKELTGISIDYYAHHKELASRIWEASKANGTFWESERVVDVVSTYLEKLYAADSSDKALEKWVGLFRADKWNAAKQYWEEARKGFDSMFA